MIEQGISSASRSPALFSSRTMIKSHFLKICRRAILFFTCLISRDMPRYTIVVPEIRAIFVRNHHCRIRLLKLTPSSLSKKSHPPPIIRMSARAIIQIFEIRYQIFAIGLCQNPEGKYFTHRRVSS